MDENIFTSKWTWVALLVAFVLLSVAIVYAFSTHRPVRIGTDDKLLSLNDPRNNMEADPAYPPPRVALEPPSDPAPKPQPKEVKVAQTPERLDRKVEKQPVDDMFPMGKVAEAPQEETTPPPLPKEDFPEITCNGKQWHSTGDYASGDQLDLTPSSCTLDGHVLYALAGSGAKPGVLFAQSLDDPDKFVIYR